MKLRLYHHPDGARVAYREAGSGPGLVLLHSALLSHREFEPIVEDLADRYRLILPDLPLHGDSEDRPRHPYTLDWLAEVMPPSAWRPRGRARWSAATSSARRSCCARRSCAPSRRSGSCSCPTRCTARRRARSGARWPGWEPCRASTAC